jgi:hypothetical protein
MIQIKVVDLNGIYILYYALLYFRVSRFVEHSKLQFELYVKQVLKELHEYSLLHTHTHTHTHTHIKRYYVTVSDYEYVTYRLAKFSVMMLDGKMFHFTSVASIRQLLEVPCKVDKGTKTIKERQGGRTEDTKEIIPS